jgi:hypothetical protein
VARTPRPLFASLREGVTRRSAYPKKSIPARKTSLILTSPLFAEGPCSYRICMGRAGGAATELDGEAPARQRPE